MKDHNPSRTSRTILVTLGALLAMAAIAWATALLLLDGRTADEPQALESATWLADGKPVTDFRLLDHSGQVFDNNRLLDRWTFAFFGFTHCPDVCPTTLAMLTAVQQQIREHMPNTPLQTVFISVDPKRDTPDRLAAYVGRFSPRFIGVTGDKSELQKLTQDLGILHIVHDDHEAHGDYMVDHSASVLLFDPAGKLAAVFSPPHRPQPISNDFQRIVESR